MKTRIIVCGSRHFNDKKICFDVLDALLARKTDVEIVSGHETGADMLGEQYAEARGLELTVFFAQRERYGKTADAMRNREILAYAMEEDAYVVAFFDQTSKGTLHMVRIAEACGVEVCTVKKKISRRQYETYEQHD